MKMCPSCKINVIGDLEQCPLCQNELHGEGSEAVFPSGKQLRKQSFIYKLQMLLALGAMVISLMLDFKIHLHGTLHWSILVAIWVVCGEILTRGLIRNHSHPARIVTYSAFWLAVAVTPTLFLIGLKGICILYVLPAIQIAVLISDFVFAMIDKTQNAMVYILADCAFAFFSSLLFIVFLPEGDVLWVSCITVSIILSLALAIFRGKRARSEINKRLNF